MTRTRKLTQRQQIVWDYIRGCKKRPPTVRELARHLGQELGKEKPISTSVVAAYLDRLEACGLIARAHDGTSRDIEVVA